MITESQKETKEGKEKTNENHWARSNWNHGNR